MNISDSILRRIGSTGLVIFERDGTLLRLNNSTRDFMLGDVSNVFVQMLQQLREAGVRFGFISDTRGMDGGTHGSSEFVALTRILDDLLKTRGAVPDFWMRWGTFLQEPALLQVRDGRRRRVTATTVLRAIEWDGVEQKETILVSSTAAGLLAASEAGITGIHYFGVQGDQPVPSPLETNPQFPYPSETMEARWLNDEIQRILSSNRRRSA